MNEKIENLLLEHMRAMRGDIASINDELRGMRSEMRTMSQHMAAFMTHENSQDGDIAELKIRLDRVEKRLDLAD